jgi:hypothetical protein
MDWRGGQLNRHTEQVREELSRELVPRLFSIAGRSNVIFNPPVFQEKGLGPGADLAARSWMLYQLLSTASRDLTASLASSLRRLTHTTAAHPGEDWGGAVRGQLNISRTILERAQKGGNPLFVAFDESVPTSDVPANQLLKLTLNRMRSDVDSLMSYHAGSGVGAELMAINSAVLPALRHPYLDALRISGTVTSQMLQASARSKVSAHFNAYRFWEQELRWKAGNLDAFLDVLSAAFIHPDNEDDLFEFFVLTKVILALSTAAQWQQIAIGLPLEKAVARFIANDLTCTVYANTSPSEALDWAADYKWKYNRVFSLYRGIGYRTRRPDIIVEFARVGQKPVPIIIETKFSENPKYIRDSIYKTFGYLADFEKLWQYHPTFVPRAILALASGITPSPTQTWETSAIQSPVAILTLTGGGIDAMAGIFRVALNTLDPLNYLG